MDALKFYAQSPAKFSAIIEMSLEVSLYKVVVAGANPRRVSWSLRFHSTVWSRSLNFKSVAMLPSMQRAKETKSQ